MKIIATQTTGKELKPGDLYSHMGQSSWDIPRHLTDVGAIVWLRTEAPMPESEMDAIAYKIEVIK